MWDDKPVDPSQVVYRRVVKGEYVDPIRVVSMYRKFNAHRETELIGALCARSGQVAVATKHLTRRQRAKYKDNRLQTGGRTYYLFDGPYLPADVGAALNMETGISIYP